MKRNYELTALALGLALALGGAACVTQPTGNSNSATGQPTPSPSSSPTPATDVSAVPVTLPVLDAFFASDESFTAELKTKLSLTDDQITQLQAVAREETGKLRETETGDHSGTTAAARELAANRVKEIVGADKGSQLAAFVTERWRAGGDDPDTKDAKTTAAAESLPASPNAVPTDTRVVVNAPAYRMDVFDAGRLVKSYKVGIGYPEFPLPTGLRKARAIIFNPTWTPPDEPWVESPSSKVKVGEKVEAGSKLNPLGLLKIPIGSPSLIHGGKSPAKLGTFASHGCVGLTDALAQDFAKVLAQVAGKKLSDADIANYKKNRSETKQVTLSEPVPVELRYETIVAEDGKLHVYRDVYDLNTNTEENLRAVLDANGVRLEDLTEDERSQVLEALEEMSRDAKGRPDKDAITPAKTTASPNASPVPSPKTIAKKGGRITRSFKGKKEIVIEIAALKGKGYPAMAVSGTGIQKTKS